MKTEPVMMSRISGGAVVNGRRAERSERALNYEIRLAGSQEIAYANHGACELPRRSVVTMERGVGIRGRWNVAGWLRAWRGQVAVTAVVLLVCGADIGAAQQPPGSGPAAAADNSAQSAKALLSRLDNGVQRFALPNGLRVVFFRRTNAPVFAGQTWVGVGGVNEQTGKTGAAHLLEHMAFKGSQTIGTKDFAKEKPLLDEYEALMQAETEHPGTADPEAVRRVTEQLSAFWVDNEFSRIYQRHGAVGLNAGTAKDYTMYQVELPSVDFELWCWMESDRLLRPVFRQFYKEREVVREERRMRTDDDPAGRLYERLMSLAYTVHPYRFPTIGWADDIRKLRTADTAKIFATYDRPDNMVIVLVGDLEPGTVKTLVERYFGRLPKASDPLPKVTEVEPAQSGERKGTVTFDANPQVMIGYHKPVYPNPDDMYFSILHSALAEGRSSYLHRELVQGKQLAAAVSTSEGPGDLFPSMFLVSSTPRMGVSVDRVTDEIQGIFDRFAAEPFPDDVFQSSKRRVKIGFLNSLDSNNELAETLGHAELLYGDWRAILTMFETVERATPHDVQELFRKYLRPENRTLVSLERPASRAGEGKASTSAPEEKK